MSLEKLVSMSHKYGQDENFVLAGGGNTSYKTDDKIYVKGSGTSLATIKEDEFVVLYRDKLQKMWTNSYPDNDREKEAMVLFDMMEARIEGEGTKRPSVETLLHDLFEYKYVLHVHPALVNGITCAKDGETAVGELFGDEAVWVPSTKPGYTLAVYCKKAVDGYKNKFSKEPKILVLQNHGIFFADNDIESIDKIVLDTMKKISSRINEDIDFSDVDFDREKAVLIIPQLRILYAKKTNNKTSVAKLAVNADIADLCKDKKSFEPMSKPFTPDHIVYYKAEPVFLENGCDIESCLDTFINEKGYVPKIAAVEGLGFVAMGSTKKECETAYTLLLDAVKISKYVKSFGGYLSLSKELSDFIINWEVESYRQKIALSSSNIKRLDEKICLVTGAAQGFGKGIAESMIEEGANVVIADMNYDGAKKLSDEINATCKQKKSLAVKANVSDEASVKAMFEACVFEYGGIDVYVNNAGIVRAGGLDEMTLNDFNLVTAVNYTAYFLCAKYSSAIMKTQYKAKNDYMVDIIEINSKSGLAGSNKNFAYAGSKFGGIGLTQSFALELAPYNIKVNAVCPGNFLDGPLWSDPEKGLFVQYLRAGKIPGAKTVEDVKKFYESKVPLGRGCLVEDVMNAVLYIIAQKYETGQALPVTGGQEMLK